MTTTTFIGDIKFKDGDTDRLVSDLATVDEVNEAFTKYYDKTQCDNTFALKSTTYTKTECDSKFALKGESGNVDLSSYYTKTQCDSKFASKRQQYSSVELLHPEFYYIDYMGWCIMCENGSTLILEGTRQSAFGFIIERKIQGGEKIDIDGEEFDVSVHDNGFLIVDFERYLEFTSIDEYREMTGFANAVYQNEVYSKTECDDKFALKSNDYIDKRMSLSTSSYSSETTYNASVGDRFRLGVRIGGGAVQYHTVILTDEFNTQAGQKFEVGAYYFTITFNPTYTRLVFKPNSNELVLNNLVLEAPNNVVYNNEVYTKTECDDKFALKNPSTTITHYAPIEESITNYHIGYPVFMSGKVYKLNENNWIQSTPIDSIDCICSCITTGNSKTFAGIITSIDNENNSITFATHGDYLFKVDDSSKYNIGDTICYDGSIIDVNTTPTIAIQQSIIGKVSGIVDDKTLAIFKTV